LVDSVVCAVVSVTHGLLFIAVYLCKLFIHGCMSVGYTIVWSGIIEECNEVASTYYCMSVGYTIVCSGIIEECNEVASTYYCMSVGYTIVCSGIIEECND